jgi:hypothetical protein
MSAYKTIECDIVNKEILLSALSLLNFSPNIHEEPQHLYGFKGDQRKEKAEIIIPREQINFFTGASNDIGFVWNEKSEKYEMIVSDYDKARKMHDRIIQAYVKEAIEKALEKNGYKIKVNIQDEDFLKRSLSDLNIVARKII